ncbi:hypothetical protein [Flavobacterium sp. HBTb2-11-1]|uniref:hypothetical protein n=1 Tax=Flavobacterium sp. HBTb2-11-1 TaxID=2692212 RepID=UPI00136A7FA1|nr:hypothetical protein [Flavobacterium sp. HBTb2-11-1]MXO04612.1 hypothetical protein [Flavobacterium sp. HBTb2-11-1]
MKKVILFFLVLTFTFFIFRFVYFTASDYINYNKCENSKFVSSNNIVIKFSNSQVNENLKILIIQKEGLKKMIRYHKIDSLSKNNLSYCLEDKILKTDTLLIKLRDKTVKISDFRRQGFRQKYGKNKGDFFCYNYIKINNIEYCLESDTIYLTSRDLLPNYCSK